MKRCKCSFTTEKKYQEDCSHNLKTELRCASQRSFVFDIILTDGAFVISESSPLRPDQFFINKETDMFTSTDQTIKRTIQIIKDSVSPITMDGHTWYDVTNQGLEAEVKLLRLKGELAEHPLISTLVRFN